MADKENKNGVPSDFGKVIDILHNKSKLPSLRTYQGDMAEFIKEKNESVISVAVKEKEREEKREENKEEKNSEINKLVTPKFKLKGELKSKINNLQINFTILFLSLFLILGGVATIFYIYSYISNRPDKQIVIEQIEIIPYNNIVTITNITKTNLREELLKISKENGITLAKISDQNGNLVIEANKLFDILEIPKTTTIQKTLKPDFAIGTIGNRGAFYPFLILKIEDFGRAFASMLDWENEIRNQLNFLVTEPKNTPETIFLWKDLIIKNKDARALIDDSGNAKIVYTFLDKNTILISGNIFLINEISDLYHSRAVAR